MLTSKWYNNDNYNPTKKTISLLIKDQSLIYCKEMRYKTKDTKVREKKITS